MTNKKTLMKHLEKFEAFYIDPEQGVIHTLNKSKNKMFYQEYSLKELKLISEREITSQPEYVLLRKRLNGFQVFGSPTNHDLLSPFINSSQAKEILPKIFEQKNNNTYNSDMPFL